MIVSLVAMVVALSDTLELACVQEFLLQGRSSASNLEATPKAILNNASLGTGVNRWVSHRSSVVFALPNLFDFQTATYVFGSAGFGSQAKTFVIVFIINSFFLSLSNSFSFCVSGASRKKKDSD
jgi:hypothetical protein